MNMFLGGLKFPWDKSKQNLLSLPEYLWVTFKASSLGLAVCSGANWFEILGLILRYS